MGSHSTRWVLLAVGLTLATQAAGARADGGAVRCSEKRSNYLLTVFTSPTPLRVGVADISVLVQDAHSGTPLTDIPILVRAHPVHHPERGMSAFATNEAATNKLLRAALLDFPEPGAWYIEVTVADSAETAPVGFEVAVAEAWAPWLGMGLWIGWPVIVVGLFSVHQWLVHRGGRGVRATSG